MRIPHGVARLPAARYTEPDVIKATRTFAIPFSGRRNFSPRSVDQVLDSEPVRSQRIGNCNRRFLQHYVCPKHGGCFRNLLVHQLARKIVAVVGFYRLCRHHRDHLQRSKPGSESCVANRPRSDPGRSFRKSLRSTCLQVCCRFPRILRRELPLALFQRSRLCHLYRRRPPGAGNHPE